MKYNLIGALFNNYYFNLFFTTSKSNDMYEFCKQIFASSLCKLIEILKLLLLVVAELLDEYLINSIL